MPKRNLIIVKKPAYVWRVNSLGMGEHFAHIPCWYVVDADTNEIIEGGYRSGNNYQSGSAYMPRKKEAKAFIDGYNAQEGSENPHNVWVKSREGMFLSTKRALRGATDDTACWWDEGNTFTEDGRKRTTIDNLR